MLYQILKSASEQFPKHIAANHENKKYSYRELLHLIDRLATSLENLGPQQGDKLAFFFLMDNKKAFNQTTLFSDLLSAVEMLSGRTKLTRFC